jgi:hypothetical protein
MLKLLKKYDDIDKIPLEFLNENIFREYIRKDNSNLNNLPEKYKTYNFYLKLVKGGDIYDINVIPEKFKDHEMYKALLVCYNDYPHNYLNIVPEKFKDREMCVHAVGEFRDNLEYVPSHFLDINFCLETIKIASGVFRNIPLHFKENDIIIKAAIECKVFGYYGCLLEYIPEHKKTYKMCMKVINMDGVKGSDDIKHIPVKFQTKSLILNFLFQASFTFLSGYNKLNYCDKKFFTFIFIIKIFLKTKKLRPSLINSFKTRNQNIIKFKKSLSYYIF